MDIAVLSMNISHLKVNQQSNVSVLKMAMVSSGIQTTEFLKMLEVNTKMM